MEAFYFGAPSGPLLATYHAPAQASAARALVCCYPLGHEYIRAHRAFRHLTLSLAREHVATLRFDYSGTGDSSQDPHAATLNGWLGDIDAAIDMLKTRAGVSRVSVVGLRFGGTLAALASSRRGDVDSLLLWDPVLDGAAYLQELATLQSAWIRDRLGLPAERVLTGQSELIGMPLTAALRDGIRAVDLRNAAVPRAARVLFAVSSTRPDCLAWHEALRGRGIPSGFSQLLSPSGWADPEAVHQLLLPHEMLKQIVSLTLAY